MAVRPTIWIAVPLPGMEATSVEPLNERDECANVADRVSRRMDSHFFISVPLQVEVRVHLHIRGRLSSGSASENFDYQDATIHQHGLNVVRERNPLVGGTGSSIRLGGGTG